MHTGINRTELCFGSAPLAADVVPCTVVPPSGSAVSGYLKLTHLTMYHATVRAFDHAGGSTAVSSPGARYFGRPPQVPVLEAPPSFMAGCSSYALAWEQVSDCDEPPPPTFSLCNFAARNCSLTVNVSASDVRRLDAASSNETGPNVRSFFINASLPLQAGVPYFGRITAIGCSTAEAVIETAPFTCDPSPPRTSGVPAVITGAGCDQGCDDGGRAAAAFPGRVGVAWHDVFSDPESGFDHFEVCISAEPVADCAADDWHSTAALKLTDLALPSRLNASGVVVPVEPIHKIKINALKRILNCVPPPDMDAWEKTGETDQNGIDVWKSVLHTCGVESINAAQVSPRPAHVRALRRLPVCLMTDD